VDSWLRTTGFDTIRATRDTEGVILTREGTRPHRFSVTTYDETLAPVEAGLVDLGDQPVRLPTAAVVVPNSGGETFARVRLDDQSWAALAGDLASVPDDGTRAVVWSTAFDMVRCGDLGTTDLLGLLTRHLPRERRVGIVDGVLAWTLGTLVPRHLAPDQVVDAVAQVAAACESGLASEPDEQVAVSLTLGLARTTPDAVLLQRWLLDRETHTGMPVEPDLRWDAIHRLAALGEISADEITDERLSDGTITGVLGAAKALAALPTPEAKAVTWEKLTAESVLSNREFTATAAGFWNAEQTALVHPYVEPYLTELLALATTRGQAFSHLVARAFPAVPLLDEHVSALERALTGEVPTVLRRGWEDTLDDLRAARSAITHA
jgi:aminopeptidase N